MANREVLYVVTDSEGGKHLVKSDTPLHALLTVPRRSGRDVNRGVVVDLEAGASFTAAELLGFQPWCPLPICRSESKADPQAPTSWTPGDEEDREESEEAVRFTNSEDFKSGLGSGDEPGDEL